MINIIIFACVFLTATLFLLGFMCYQVIKMTQLLAQIKVELMKNDMMMQWAGKKIRELDTKFEEQLETLKSIPKAQSANPAFMPKEVIEQNYERAKSLIKRGVPLDLDLMKSCAMTEEEFELLTEMTAKE